MTALPAATDFTDASTTEGEFKTAITDQRAFLAGLLGTDGTISTGQSTLKTLCSAANARSAGSYTIAAADRGKVIHVTGSGASAFTVPTTATTDFGVGWACAVRNDCSSGDITLTRSSTDTIDGVTSVTLAPGQSTILAITAAGKWVTIGKGTAAATETASGIVELATTAEAVTGTDTARAVTPAGALAVKKASSYSGTDSTNGTTVKQVASIPSWATKLTVAWASVSTNQATHTLLLQIGAAGGFETSGYYYGNGDSTASGFRLIPASLGGQADDVYGGVATLVKVTGNTWAASYPQIDSGAVSFGCGQKTLSDVLTQVRIITDSGTFDAGTLTVYWE